MNDNQVSETKEFVKDLAGSTVEVGTSLVIENLPEFGAEVAGIIGNEAIGATIQTLTGGLLGAVAPSLLGVKLSFQQKRFERNMIKMVTSLREKQEIIEQRMNQLNPDVQQKFISGPYRDVLLDNIVSENQEQKVQDNINGYINLMGIENPNDDIVFTFFHTLSQMNELDIRILKLYRPTYEMSEEEQESFQDVMRDEDIDQSQYNFIREKLCRLGMLYSKNTEKRDENLDILGEKLTELIKQLHSKKPKEVKAPKLKRITRSESYRITRLGRQYLTFIDEPQ
mgnify:CR=1 FL=1